MKLTKYLFTAGLITVVLAACGRRLPEEQPVVSQPTSEPVATEEASDDTTTIETDVMVANNEDVEDEIMLEIRTANVANGENLFNQAAAGGLACSNCHSARDDSMIVGPGLYGLPNRTDQRVADQVAERYLYNSIVHPNDYLVDDYAANVMPQNYGEFFTDEQVYDMVAYLMTLRDEPLIDDASIVEENTAQDIESKTVIREVTVVVTSQPEIVVVTATPAPGVAVAQASADATPAPATIDDPETAAIATFASLGQAEFGEDLFHNPIDDLDVACSDCHTNASNDDPNVPTLEEVLTAQGVVPQRYLYEALTNEELHVGIDHDEDINYTELLSLADTYDLVAYMLNLPTEGTEPLVRTDDEQATVDDDQIAEAVDTEQEMQQSTDDQAQVDDRDAEIAQAVANADASHGETLFNEMTSAGLACSNCHLVDSEEMLVGPGLLGIPEYASTRIAGVPAETYLWESIVQTNDYIVDGYPAMVMPQNYPEIYSDQDVYDLIAYLMTLDQ